MRILLADDDPLFSQFLQHLLKEDGHEVQLASDGNRALTAFASLAFDLVITDLMLPGRDGLAVARKIRESHPNQDILLVTGVDLKGRCPDGIDFVLSKPVNRAQLKLVLGAVEGAH
jgi:CheY-like chemotaxis protein